MKNALLHLINRRDGLLSMIEMAINKCCCAHREPRSPQPCPPGFNASGGNLGACVCLHLISLLVQQAVGRQRMASPTAATAADWRDADTALTLHCHYALAHELRQRAARRQAGPNHCTHQTCLGCQILHLDPGVDGASAVQQLPGGHDCVSRANQQLVHALTVCELHTAKVLLVQLLAPKNEGQQQDPACITAHAEFHWALAARCPNPWLLKMHQML